MESSGKQSRKKMYPAIVMYMRRALREPLCKE